MEVKVFGSGCERCKETENLVKSVIQETESNATVEKVSDIREMMSFGIMAIPAVVIDGKVMIAGAVPSREALREWLILGESEQADLSASNCRCSSGCGCQ